jgi:hypothetical protein
MMLGRPFVSIGIPFLKTKDLTMRRQIISSGYDGFLASLGNAHFHHGLGRDVDLLTAGLNPFRALRLREQVCQCLEG